MIRTARTLAVLVVTWPLAAGADHELENRDTARGLVLYREHCASCHGTALEGQANWRTPGDDGVLPAPPHDASGHTWHHDNRLLFDYTKLGGEALTRARGITGFQSGMPGFGGVLDDGEIWDILAWIRSTWPDDIRAIQAGRNPVHRR